MARPRTAILARSGSVLATALCLILSEVCRAELPAVKLTRLRPAGANAGQTVEVQVEGGELEEVASLLFDRPGFQAEFVKDKPLTFKVTVGNDVPPGAYDVRAVGRFGVSNPRLFAVSTGMTDVPETEPNSDVASAQSVAVNSAISGEMDGNGQDYFRVPLKAGQTVVINCLSARLDYDVDPLLTLFDAQGRVAAGNSDHHGRDPQILFECSADGDYLLELRDLTYRGGAPYRLLISDGPYVETVFPPVVQTGRANELQILGRNLPNSRASSWKLGAVALQEATASWQPEADVVTRGGFRFIEHPSHHSPIATAATCTLVGQQFAPFPSWPVTLMTTSLPVQLDREPNDRSEQSQEMTLPAVVAGRFDAPRDADWYQFATGDADAEYGFDVYSERIAGRSDPFLVVYDDKGGRVAELDDFGHRINAFDGHLRDPSGMVRLNGKRTYRLLVQDRYQRGGARNRYVLSARLKDPDVYAAVIPQGNNAEGTTTIRQGGAIAVDVVLHRRDGFNGPVVVTADALPSGVHAAPMTIPNDTRGVFVLWADANAPAANELIQLTAAVNDGERSFQRDVRPHTRVVDNQGSRVTRSLALGVRGPSPFGLSISPETVAVSAGQSMDVVLNVVRNWPEAKAAINYQPLQFPNGFSLSSGTVPEGANEAKLTINVPENMQPGEYTLVVQGQSQVPFSKNADAKDRPNTLVSQPSRPLRVTVSPKPKT